MSKERLVCRTWRASAHQEETQNGLKSRSDKATDRRENPHGPKMCIETEPHKSKKYIAEHGIRFHYDQMNTWAIAVTGKAGSNGTLTQHLGNQPGACPA